MAADFQQLIQDIKEKHRALVERYTTTARQLDDARRRIADLQYTVRQQESTIDRLNTQIEFLTVVNTTMPDRDDIDKSRAILTNLVREIDKCITDLTE